MSKNMGRRVGRFLEVGAVMVCVTAGCAPDSDPPIARNRVMQRPVEPERIMRPLSPAPDTDPSPDTGLARAEDVSVDARLLVITADGTDAAFGAITDVLGMLGTPFDVLNATTGPTLTADVLAVGDHGRYYGIILDDGDLVAGNLSAFSNQEWMTLASYEARFGVRRVVMYAYPTDDYGLTSTGGFDVSTRPITALCTVAGDKVFVGANCAAPVAIEDGWAYSSQPIDAATVPLLIDGAGAVYAATRGYPDGREALVLTFAQSATALHTLQLGYGIVNWVTRGLFVGERHVYLSPQIDDLFLASQLYPSGTYRITGGDLQAFADWQNARRADPLTAAFRSAFAFNAFGAKPPGRDSLTDKALELGPSFDWINHTWDHTEMDAMSYTDAFEEFTRNNQYGLGSGLSRFSVENLVTPSISGLGNAEVMRAAYDVGIRQVVSDASARCQDNPTPNTGYYNALVPALLQIPRRPTDLYFNVSLPAEWIAEYEMLHSEAVSYEQIIETESASQVRHMLRGDNDPWMFHQANLRDLGAGQSLITAYLDAVLNKYAARATFPVVSPTMDELARKVKARMAFDAAGVSATLEPGAKLTVRVTKAATIPVTGLCTLSAEAYGGQRISYLQLGDGESVTLSLADDCNPDFVPTGGSGAPGAGAGTPTVGGNCPAGGGAGGSGGGAGGSGGGGAGEGGVGGSTMGTLTTDAAIDPIPPSYQNGCGCMVVSDARRAGAASSLLGVLAVIFAVRRRGRGARSQASCAMRPSLSARSMR
jgi:hypothetical protein